MIRRILLFIFLAMTPAVIILPQSLSHQVLAPAAGQAVHDNLNYSQTIGQTAVEIAENAGFVLTQGFQQPLIITREDTSLKGNGVDVYPNPATDFINVKLFGDVARNFRIELINITGTIIKSVKINFVTDYYYIEQIPVSDIKIGFYFVRVISEDKLILRTFKIEKL
ncbi:MAG TPA: T9SS type A sorting domain-containing protein [Bacteroidales bacterium]|nr:T9SS type A sorting domain-containing protein [Bacteroidales bacterium]